MKEECWACSIQLAEACAKHWDLCWNLKVNGNVWALKWCEDYSNVAFSGMTCAELFQSLPRKFVFWTASGEKDRIATWLVLIHNVQISYRSFPKVAKDRYLLKVVFVRTHVNLHLLTLSAGIATVYGPDGSGIESRWRRDRSQRPVQWVPNLSWG